MEWRSGALAITLAVFLSFLALSIAASSAASGSPLSVQVFASPTQVMEQQNFTLSFVVVNAGKASVNDLTVCIFIPGSSSGSGSWTLKPEGSTPDILRTNPTNCLQPQTTSTNATIGQAFSLDSVAGNGTEFAQFEVYVPLANAGSYMLFVVVNSPVGAAQGNLAMVVQGPAPLALGSALSIPVSLALILLPGFATVIVALWLSRNQISTWEVGLVAALLAFFFGYVEWAYVGGYPSFHPLSSNAILNLDPATVSLWTSSLVAVASICAGLGAGAVILGANYARAWLANGWHNLSIRQSALHKGYIEETDPTWKSLLKESSVQAVKLHGGGWLPQVKVTLSPGSQAAKPPPAQPGPPKVVAHTEAANAPPSGEEPGAQPDAKPTLVGLLEAFDDVDPFDIVIGPTYKVTVNTKGKNWDAIRKKLPELGALELQAKAAGAIRTVQLPDAGGLIEDILVDHGKVEAVQLDGNTVTGRVYIKGSEIFTLEVLDPKPQYYFTPLNAQ